MKNAVGIFQLAPSFYHYNVIQIGVGQKYKISSRLSLLNREITTVSYSREVSSLDVVMTYKCINFAKSTKDVMVTTIETFFMRNSLHFNAKNNDVVEQNTTQYKR